MNLKLNSKIILIAGCATALMSCDQAQNPDENPSQVIGPLAADADFQSFEVSSFGFRSIDGYGNNQQHPEFGAAGALQLRYAPPSYSDSLGKLPGGPSPRFVSNQVVAQSARVSKPNKLGVSDYIWAWGQFVDHDIVLTEVGEAEPKPIEVPVADPFFDPFASGTASMEFHRSKPVFAETGLRQFPNAITAFIDGSMVYGSDAHRAAALRANDGSGKLASSSGQLLPFNRFGLENDPPGPRFFLAGDVRANENIALTALHTLFVREHNYWCDQIAKSQPEANGDTIYELARAVVIGEIQQITYEEYLPALIGNGRLAPYDGYKAEVSASIELAFSTAAFRHGHSLLSPTLRRLDSKGRTIAAGDVSLKDAFFAPGRIIDEGGIAPILRGLAAQRSQELDVQIISDLRNFLFGPPGSGGLDLASLNIQRGRDHGVSNYNSVRKAYGLKAVKSFAAITADVALQRKLEATYGNVDRVDTWVGGLAEDKLEGSMLGSLFTAIVKDQFERLRDGDRLWYTRVLPAGILASVEKQSLATIISRNTVVGGELQNNVFYTDSAQCPGDDDRPDQSVVTDCDQTDDPLAKN